MEHLVLKAALFVILPSNGMEGKVQLLGLRDD
jgi:hypothetical protein